MLPHVHHVRRRSEFGENDIKKADREVDMFLLQWERGEGRIDNVGGLHIDDFPTLVFRVIFSVSGFAKFSVKAARRARRQRLQSPIFNP